MSPTRHQHYTPNGPMSSRSSKPFPLYKNHHPSLKPVQTLPIITSHYLDPRLKFSQPISHYQTVARDPSSHPTLYFAHSFDSHLSHSLPPHSLPLLRHSVPVKSVSAENCSFIGRDTLADVLAFLNAQSTKDFMNNSFAYRETFDSPTHDYSMWQARYDQRSSSRLSKKAHSLCSTDSRHAFRSNRSTTVTACCPADAITKKVDPFDPYPDLEAVNKSRRLAKDVGHCDAKTKSLPRRDSIKSIIDEVRSVLVKQPTTIKPPSSDAPKLKVDSSQPASVQEPDSGSGSDEVFKKIAAPHAGRSTRHSKRRTSSLETKRRSPAPTHSHSIAHPVDCSCNLCSANARSNEPSFPSVHHNHTQCQTIAATASNSGYDGRDRGRGRDLYRDNRQRDGGGSDRENDGCDRDQRSDRGSFNRSMSNAEGGTPDDKIGESSGYCTICC